MFGMYDICQTLDENGEKVWVTMALVTIFAIVMVFSTSGAVIAFCLVRIIREMAPTKFVFLHIINRLVSHNIFA